MLTTKERKELILWIDSVVREYAEEDIQEAIENDLKKVREEIECDVRDEAEEDIQRRTETAIAEARVEIEWNVRYLMEGDIQCSVVEQVNSELQEAGEEGDFMYEDYFLHRGEN